MLEEEMQLTFKVTAGFIAFVRKSKQLLFRFTMKPIRTEIEIAGETCSLHPQIRICSKFCQFCDVKRGSS
jgi:hypothetical protein